MKIAINTLSENPLAPSGAFEYYRNIIQELDLILNDEDELFIFVSKKSEKYFGQYNNPRLKKIIFHYSNENKLLRVLTEHIVFPFVILYNKIDILNTGTGLVYCPCRLVATMKTMHIYTNPKSLSPMTKLYRKIVYWRTKNQAAAIISNSKSHTADIIKYTGIETSKIKMVYEAFDHNIFKVPTESITTENANPSIRKPYLLFVSSLYKYKNAETLIEAYSMLPIKLKESFDVIIVGYPREKEYYNSLISLVKEKNIKENVVFTGGISHEKIAEYYQNAYLFVYPSYYETFGLTILEAMACGCPVIASNKGSIPEVGGDASLYFNPSSADELCDLVKLLVLNNKKRDDLIEKGLHRSKQFNWRTTVINTYKVYKTL